MRVGSRLACPRALCHTCGRTARPPRSCSRSVGKICRAWTRSRLSSLFTASPQSNPRRPPLDPECGPDLDTTRILVLIPHAALILMPLAVLSVYCRHCCPLVKIVLAFDEPAIDSLHHTTLLLAVCVQIA